MPSTVDQPGVHAPFGASSERSYAPASEGLQGDLDEVVQGLPPIPHAAPAARLTQQQGMRHLVQVVLGILLVALVVEILATFAIRTFGAGRGEIVGPEGVVLRVDAAAARGAYVLVLGDSVMGNGALARTLGTQAEGAALGALLRDRLMRADQRIAVADLSMEGALANDYAGLLALAMEHARRPSAVVMQLDYRVLSPVHDEEQHLSRSWLQPYVPTVAPVVAREYGSPEFLRRPIDEWTARALLDSSAYVLLRGGRTTFTKSLLAVIGPSDGPPAASSQDPSVLRLLVERFYGTDRSVASSRVLTDLLRILDLLARRHVPVLVTFTPANFDFLGQQVNVPAYFSNLGTVERAVRRLEHRGASVRWVNFQGDVPPSMFLDHCHLTPEGNQRLADRMFAELALLLRDGQPH